MTTRSPGRRSFLRGAAAGLACLAAGRAGLARAAEESLVLGVFPRFSAAETTTRYTPLAEYLRERLNR